MTHAAAIYMPPESELIRRLSKVYEEQTGKKAELKSIGAAPSQVHAEPCRIRPDLPRR